MAEKRFALLQGNEACVEGAIAAGMRFYSGYPITPSTEIAENSAVRLPQVGGKFIQMEDEIGGMAAAIGASVAGVKAMTATSGPGFSLKQENIGYAAMAEIPVVIVNVQRSGPSTGLPTSPSQGDVMQTRWGTHGDHPIIVISPSSVQETYNLTVRAFNLSEKYHTIRTVKFLRSATIPVVELMDVQGERLDMEVGFDNRQAAFDMVCTMLEKRVRHKILYLGSKDDTRDEQRYQGYCDAMMLHNLSPLRMNPRAISSIHLGMQLMRDALSANPDLDGVFCTNDDIAMGALLLCRERNLAVPEQISIAGFHGLEIGRQMIPSLASVITPRFDIGRMAAQMLLSKIKNNDHNHNTVDLGYQIYHGNTL